MKVKISLLLLLLPAIFNAQWVQTNGPIGGKIISLAAKRDTIFAATDDAGIFYTTNSEKKWHQFEQNIFAYAMIASKNRLLIGTASGLIRMTWNGTELTKDTLKAIHGYRFSFVQDGMNIYVGTIEAGLYKSSDYGRNWIQIYNGKVNAVTISGSNLLLGEVGLRLSTNNGITWNKIKINTQNGVLSFCKIGIKLYARTMDSVFVSTDNGINWNICNQELTNKHNACIVKTGDYYVAGTSSGIFISTDAGNNWVQKKDELINKSVNALLINGPIIYAGTKGSGVFISNNKGESWARKSDGLPRAEVYCFASFSNGIGGSILLAGTAESGVFISSNGGMDWEPISSGLPNTRIQCLVANTDGTRIFAGSETQGIFKTTDFGNEWYKVNQGLTCNDVASLVFNTDGTKLFAGTYGYNGTGIFLTTNSGRTWNPVNNGLAKLSVESFTICNSNLIAGTSSGIFYSTDEGVTWNTTKIKTGGISAISCDGKILFASDYFSHIVYKSSDDGKSWEIIDNDTFWPINSLTLSGDNLFVGLDSGILLYPKYGTQKKNFVGLNMRLVRALIANTTHLFAGISASTSTGLWRRPLTEMLTSINDQTELPNSFSLSQNYPNPFNPSTTINYTIPVETGYIPSLQHVTLKVFDVLGREVATLVNEYKQPGNYEVTFNTSHVSSSLSMTSGIYFYKLHAGEYYETKKMVLIK